MKTTKKMKSFIKQFIAMVSGNDTQARAEEALRQADYALNARIYSLKGGIMKKENDVKNAKRDLDIVTINRGCPIIEEGMYVDTLVKKKNIVITAEAELKRANLELAFLEERLGFLSQEEE